MAYKYLLEYHTEEHMLYPKEIADLYGVLTQRGERNTRIVNLVLEEYRVLQGLEYPAFYWGDVHKNFRVYPFAQYDPAMRWFLERANRTHSSQYEGADGKTYNFVLREPHPNLLAIWNSLPSAESR